MTRGAAFFFLCLFVLGPAARSADKIPAERLPAGGWDAGVPKGIPSDYKQFCDVRQSIPGSHLVAQGDGTTDDAPAIQAAISLCPDRHYVFIPAGTYRLNSGLSRAGLNRYDGTLYPYSIVIRGDGPDKTRLRCYANQGDIISLGPNGGYSGWWPVTKGSERGSTRITAAVGNVPVGKWIIIQRDNTQSGANGAPKYMGSTCSQMVKVAKRDGNELTIWPKLNEGYRGDKVATTYSPAYRCGIEDLYLERMVNGGQHNIALNGAEECWVRNVESVNPQKWNIRLTASAGCEIRRCVVRKAWNGGGDSGYGVGLFSFCCNNLIEDNIAEHCRHSYILEYGGQNNVIAYNYSREPINENQLRTDYLMGDLCLHGGNPRYNLFEGNVAAMLKFDRVLGGSDFTTAFRNQIQRKGLASTYVACFGSDIQRWNYAVSLVGNVYEPPPERSRGTPLRRWGTDQDNAQDPDPKAEATAWLDGEADMQQDSTAWKDGPHPLPASLLYKSKPTWWDEGPWPGIGPDRTPKNGGNPALRRWQAVAVPFEGPSIAR